MFFSAHGRLHFIAHRKGGSSGKGLPFDVLGQRSRKKQKDVLTCSVGPAAGSGLPGLYGQDQTSAKTLIMLLIFQASYSPDKFFPIIHHQLAKEITP